MRQIAPNTSPMAMNARNKKIVLDFYRQVVSEGKHELAAQFVSPEYQDHNAAPAVGIAALLNHLDGLRKTFPDFSMQCHEAIAEGDWVAVRVTAQGTHTGEWMGIAPTGKKIGLKGINLDRVVDGLIVEHYGEADTLSMLMQMDANPGNSLSKK